MPKHSAKQAVGECNGQPARACHSIQENLTKYGVEYAIAQLSSQFDAVVIDRDLALTFKGKISPVTTQAQGPQEHAKKKM
jgi:hypothetical protein